MAITKTEGAKQLREKLTGWGAQSEMARRLGVSATSVSDWLAGMARPSHVHRVMIEKMLGISAASWLTPREAKRLAASF